MSVASVAVAAHPRSRGENLLASISIVPSWGSSPLTRGKRHARRDTHRHTGLIPAHAGKTSAVWVVIFGLPAHPRSRGENTADSRRFDAWVGSSPLTRGKRRHSRVPSRTRGLIPAHAGKTASLIGEHRAPGAHPRSRGENDSIRSDAGTARGSSPLTRGKPTSSPSRKTPSRAHPRSRGENSSVTGSPAPYTGSSTLTRGKRRGCDLAQASTRLIPAHAGKTCGAFELVGLTPAHPRSRGENHQLLNVRLRNVGSSPLTRGKPHRRADQHRSERLIPAHAGKTQPCPCRTSRRTAHPRSRGENHAATDATRNLAGSSPLTRGKRSGDHS